MRDLLTRFARDESAGARLEYVLIIALGAVVIIGAQFDGGSR